MTPATELAPPGPPPGPNPQTGRPGPLAPPYRARGQVRPGPGPTQTEGPAQPIGLNRCDGCALVYDDLAYTHHFDHDHCDEHEGIPIPLLICTRHRLTCPLHSAEYRELIGGWTGRQRECQPIYTFRAGYKWINKQDRIPATWLSISAAEIGRPR